MYAFHFVLTNQKRDTSDYFEIWRCKDESFVKAVLRMRMRPVRALVTDFEDLISDKYTSDMDDWIKEERSDCAPWSSLAMTSFG